MFLKPISLKKHLLHLPTEKKFSVYRSLWHKSQDYMVLTDFPLHLDLELSGKCNFNCTDCFQNGLIHGELGLMDRVLYEKIITDGIANGLCAVKLQIRGESFLHPDIFDMIKFAKDQGILDVQITTNGSLLTDRKIDRLIETGIDAVIFSVDTHHAENSNVNEKKNNVENHYFLRTEDLINYLLDQKRIRQIQKPWVRIRSSLPHADVVQSIQTKKLLKEKFPLADRYIIGRIHNFKDNEDAYPDLQQNYRLEKCAYLTQRLAVFWNGDVTTCCMDYNNQFHLGNVSDAGIKDIWLSEKMHLFRQRHLNNERSNMPICRHCHACSTLINPTVFHDTTPRHAADTQ